MKVFKMTGYTRLSVWRKVTLAFLWKPFHYGNRSVLPSCAGPAGWVE
jgi:hypothetical protein